MNNYPKRIKSSTILAVLVIIIFSLVFYLQPTNTAIADDSCPAMSPRIGCRGPWPIRIQDRGKDPKESPAQVKERNERRVADAINNYIKLNAWGTSRLFEINNGDPGMTFLKVGEAQKINPVFLVAMTGAETHYATVGASMDCGNPFGQPPTAKNPVCTAKDGSKWYEYNKEHKLDEDMLNDQALRIWHTYVNDPHVRSLEDFLEAYTPLAQNPYRDTPQSQCTASMGVRCGAKERYINALETIPRDAKGAIVCSENGTGGGDLANADALTVKGIECVLDATGHGYNLKPYAQQLYDAAHQYNINPLYSLAQFNKDSSMGTAGAGEANMNPGNIGCDSGYAQAGITAGCADFATFSTYGDGMTAHNWLIRTEYIDVGYDTIEKIINRYAPPSENDTEKYIQDVKDFMEQYSGICANQ